MKAVIFLIGLVLVGCGKPTPVIPGPVIPGCTPLPVADAGPGKNLILGLNLPKFVVIGTSHIDGTAYKWTPAEGLDNPNSAQPQASPATTTEYTVTATNQCGQATSKMTVSVFAE